MFSENSYRDPSGFVFSYKDEIYRQVNKIYVQQYDRFVSAGLYDQLVSRKMLIPHAVINENLTGSPDWYITLKPEKIESLSYPYEWSFSMLKDAALLTLSIMKLSISYGMILKDATPYNIQWHKGQLTFIDTLSFENYDERKPWVAYRQFCETFLAPLLLMHYSKKPLQQLMLAWPEGIPVSVASSLLPLRSRFALYPYLHIHLNAKYSESAHKQGDKKISFSKPRMLNLLNSLESLVLKLKLPASKSTWSDYYNEAASRDDYLFDKKTILKKWFGALSAEIRTALDIGSNTGEFSFLLSERGVSVVAVDTDAVCIERLYRHVIETGEKNILPLVSDFANPAPGIGINNEERPSFISRVRPDLSLALAVIHHLAIGKNIPLNLIAEMFANQTCKKLIIEFVPLSDEKTKILLKAKEIMFDKYTEENFLLEFLKYFELEDKAAIANSGRVLYNFNKKASVEK